MASFLESLIKTYEMGNKIYSSGLNAIASCRPCAKNNFDILDRSPYEQEGTLIKRLMAIEGDLIKVPKMSGTGSKAVHLKKVIFIPY